MPEMEDVNLEMRDESKEVLTGGRRRSSQDEAIFKTPARGVLADGWKHYLINSNKEFFFGSKINILMVCAPLAYASKESGWGHGPTFMLSLLAICPFAERVGFVTEDVAKYTNSTVGGLLNATMGNITELIVSIAALRAGLLWVVQISLLGSILNLLLMLGCAFLAGGIRYPTQNFHRVAASTNTGMMLLASMTILLPDVLQMTHTASSKTSLLNLSRALSVILLTCYGLYLLFQLKTHQTLFEDPAPEEGEEEEEEEPPVLGFWGGIVWMALVTAAISFLSEWLVEALEGAALDWHLPAMFIGAILVPIVGNAAEHAAAVIFGYKNKMALSLGIAMGSSTQIALFVLPLMVVIAWGTGQPLSLDFDPFATAAVMMTVILVSFVTSHGDSNWLSGMMLLLAYAAIAAGFWVHCDPAELMSDNPCPASTGM